MVSFSRTSLRLVTPKFLHSSRSSPVRRTSSPIGREAQPDHALAGPHREVEVGDRPVEQRLLVGAHRRRARTTGSSCHLVGGELAQLQALGGQHLADFDERRFAEVLAGQQLLLGGLRSGRRAS